MIRVEIVLKDKWGYSNSVMERALKREITETVFERAQADDAEIIRIQFLAPPRPKRKRAAA